MDPTAMKDWLALVTAFTAPVGFIFGNLVTSSFAHEMGVFPGDLGLGAKDWIFVTVAYVAFSLVCGGLGVLYVWWLSHTTGGRKIEGLGLFRVIASFGVAAVGIGVLVWWQLNFGWKSAGFAAIVSFTTTLAASLNPWRQLIAVDRSKWKPSERTIATAIVAGCPLVILAMSAWLGTTAGKAAAVAVKDHKSLTVPLNFIIHPEEVRIVSAEPSKTYRNGQCVTRVGSGNGLQVAVTTDGKVVELGSGTSFESPC